MTASELEPSFPFFFSPVAAAPSHPAAFRPLVAALLAHSLLELLHVGIEPLQQPHHTQRATTTSTAFTTTVNNGCRRRVLPVRRCWCCCWRLQIRLPRSLRGAAPASYGPEKRQLVDGTQRDVMVQRQRDRGIKKKGWSRCFGEQPAINNPISTQLM
uniref:Candidate secreted effector n=1 Tax=Meloidogyne incognita TaxID=6306 RepID=A0A914LTL9_MELIC